MPYGGIPATYPNIGGTDIAELISTLLSGTEGAIGGMGTAGVGAMPPEYMSALTTLLGGTQIDTAGAESAATASANLMLDKALASIGAGAGATGKLGSTAQVAKAGKAGSEMGTMLGEKIAGIKTGAESDMYDRMLAALAPALGYGELGLAGKKGEAAAGTDLLSLLLGMREPGTTATAAGGGAGGGAGPSRTAPGGISFTGGGGGGVGMAGKDPFSIMNFLHGAGRRGMGRAPGMLMDPFSMGTSGGLYGMLGLNPNMIPSAGSLFGGIDAAPYLAGKSQTAGLLSSLIK